MNTIIILTSTIILLFLLLGWGNIILKRYRNDPYKFSNNARRIEWLPIKLADRYYRKKGDYWLKSCGYKIINRQIKDSISIKINPFQQLSLSDDKKSIELDKRYSSHEELGSPMITTERYGGNDNFLLETPSEELNIEISIKQTLIWLLNSYIKANDFLLSGRSICPKSQARKRWASMFMRIYKIAQEKETINLTSSHNEDNLTTVEKELKEYIIHIMYQLPDEVFSSFECSICQKKYSITTILINYSTTNYFYVSSGEWSYELACRNFFCPEQHIIARVISICN